MQEFGHYEDYLTFQMHF